ncbi:RNA polymerase subunit sigma-24 [Enterovibrio sp. ZSDZ35]|uniref:RNA polymerase subunit sigma-24 n=1 Tax=Enterovibrio qingdaonensis TaxID=2899818 RepID=A0ABT5QJ37_9GAMM|nr:DUF6596 domain-containing protein [Enterovibrio sp. ZSDZ35]MDD1780999.1 RNA polymerase subunit sigma-24 [Enterovibrio sp. ZSDZ35]
MSKRLEEIYRQESSKILAALIRIFGVENVELAEDTLHEAFGKALVHWKENGEPENPGAWLMLTAKNHAIDVIRKHRNSVEFADDLSLLLESEWTLVSTVDKSFSEEALQEDMLNMIFWCCHPLVKVENQIPMILKTLCGFSLSAVSKALILPEETVKKRLGRTRQQLRKIPLNRPDADRMSQALDTVHVSLYLLFNEGLYSTDENTLIDVDFCKEAMSLLARLIAAPHVANRETLALYALMHFHMARLQSRVDEQGAPVPLDLQQRERWDRVHIQQGLQWLAFAKTGLEDGGIKYRFMLEAMIASEHSKAASFGDTNWQEIERLYDALYGVTASPVSLLNQAVANAYLNDMEKAIALVKEVNDEKRLSESHLPDATLAHIFAKSGDETAARFHAKASMAKGGTQQEQQLMLSQIERLLRG